MTTLSSSPDSVLDIRIPTRWEELDEMQLEAVLKLLTLTPERRAAPLLLLSLAGIKVERPVQAGYICRLRNMYFLLSADDVAGWLHWVDFITTIPDIPVRLSRMGPYRAVDNRLHGISLETWLTLDNYYQGYHHSRNIRAVAAMAPLLYPGFKGQPEPYQVTGILLWMAAVKQQFARLFPELFIPAPNVAEDGVAPDMAKVVNAQIRALTGGDVTKEPQVLETDCWRALTELNEKAREYRMLKEK